MAEKTIAVNGVEQKTSLKTIDKITAAQLAFGDSYNASTDYSVICHDVATCAGTSLTDGQDFPVTDGMLVNVAAASWG